LDAVASGAIKIRVRRPDSSWNRTSLDPFEFSLGATMGIWFVITPDGGTYATTYFVSQSELFRVTGLR
jgi:hypothetical protein